MDQVQVPPHARLALARRETTGGRIVPAVKRAMGIYQQIECIVPFTNSIPSENELEALMARTRDATEEVLWTVSQ
jgi:hypothetical protein